MENEHYSFVTEQYYSKWVGVDSISALRGVEAVFSEERDRRQNGCADFSAR